MSNAADTSTPDRLALAAVDHIRDGMIVGLGTGRAAERAIRALAFRASAQNWSSLRCVATSICSARIADDLRLRVQPMSQTGRVDLLFDGADEVDPALAMTKGRGGAMTREKIVAESAHLRIYLIDKSKLVAHLGDRFPLPVEVLEFALATVTARLSRLGLGPIAIRANESTQAPVRTDDNNLILDSAYGQTSRGNLAALSQSIDSIPGVIGHGLFVNHADIVLIEDPATGSIDRRTRQP